MKDFYNIKKNKTMQQRFKRKTGCKNTSLWVYNDVLHHSDVTEAG